MQDYKDELLRDHRRSVNVVLRNHKRDVRTLELIKCGLEAKLQRVNRQIASKKQVIQTTIKEVGEFKKLME